MKVCFEEISCRISHLEPPIYKDHQNDDVRICYTSPSSTQFSSFQKSLHRGKAKKLKNGWIGEKLDSQQSNRDTLKKSKALG